MKMYRDSCNDKYKPKHIILICGKSGAGKTTFYNQNKDSFGEHCYLNNDVIRALTSNTDFGIGGRMKAAYTMRKKALEAKESVVVVDMICPLKEMRSILKPNIIILIETNKSRYEENVPFEHIGDNEAGLIVKIKNPTN